MCLDKKGMTLVEVLMALVVLLLVSLAMLQTALFSIENNMINVLRDEAVSIAEMRMNEARNIPFDNLASDVQAVTRPLRNLPPPGLTYNTTRTVIILTADNRRVDVGVAWTWKGQPYTHSISTILRRQ